MTTLVTKPLRRRVTVRPAGHLYKPALVVTLHPGGVLELREPHHRAGVRLDLGRLYAQAMIAEARTARRKGTRC